MLLHKLTETAVHLADDLCFVMFKVFWASQINGEWEFPTNTDRDPCFPTTYTHSCSSVTKA